MRKLGMIALACVGLLLTAQGLSLVMTSFSYAPFIDARGWSKVLWVGLATTPGIVVLGIAALLVFGRTHLASRLFDDEPLGVGLDLAQLLRLGLILVGVSTAADAVPGVAYALINLLAPQGYGGLGLFGAAGGGRAAWVLAQSIVPSSLQLILGVCLLAFSRPLTRRLWRDGAPRAFAGTAVSSCPSCGRAYDPADYEGDQAGWRCTTCHAGLAAGNAEQALQPDATKRGA